MACERWREVLSAQLDGEQHPDDPAADDHLAGCPACRQWLDHAATVNRLTRTRLVAEPPDLTAAILAAVPAQQPAPAMALGAGQRGADKLGVGTAGTDLGPSRRARLVSVLFIALAAVGAGQLMLGLAQVGGGSTGEHSHAGAGLTATPGHLWHESAAWNVAVGAAFLFIGLRRNRPTGLVPLLSAFVGMLLLLSVNDLTAGRVEVARLVGHGFVIAGYLIVVTLSRITIGDAAPPGDRERTGWRVSFDDGSEPAVAAAAPGLRLVRRAAPGPATAQASKRAA